jgi:Fe-S cluster assembly protein SufD
MAVATGGDLGTLGAAAELLGRSGPEWLRTLRAKVVERAETFGLPTREFEEWRYTGVGPLAETEYQLPQRSAAPLPTVPKPDLRPAAKLVFIDGELDANASDVRIPGVTITPLPDEDEPPPAFASLLADNVRTARDALEALAGGLLTTGVMIHIRRGTIVHAPISVQFVHTNQRDTTLNAPQVLIIAEEDTHALVVEDHIGDEVAQGLTLATTSLVAGENAHVRHALLVRDGRSWTHFSTLRVRQSRASRVASHRIVTGGALVRNNVLATLEGDGADLVLNGLFVPTGRQHHDNHMRVEHCAEHCTSRQYYRGLLADHSNGVFTGRILVAPGAQRTDAIQSNANLLLSPTARVYSKPQLEIYADDVKCTHGATTGQLDDEALFYLRSRGLPETEARLLLLHAFAGECIDRIDHEGLRTWIREAINARLTAVLRASS